MTFNVVLRFFDSRYNVSLTWNSNPRPSDFHSDTLPTELASLTQGRSSTVDVYTRSDIEAHKLVPDCFKVSCKIFQENKSIRKYYEDNFMYKFKALLNKNTEIANAAKAVVLNMMSTS